MLTMLQKCATAADQPNGRAKPDSPLRKAAQGTQDML